MKNKKTKILFICILKASVIQKDLELLKKHFDVRVVDFILSRKNLKGTLKTLKSIPSMIMGVIWADVYWMPSEWEGLGIAALEAMACGLPVIASSIGGLREVVLDEEAGYLVPKGSRLSNSRRKRFRFWQIQIWQGKWVWPGVSRWNSFSLLKKQLTAT